MFACQFTVRQLILSIYLHSKLGKAGKNDHYKNVTKNNDTVLGNAK